MHDQHDFRKNNQGNEKKLSSLWRDKLIRVQQQLEPTVSELFWTAKSVQQTIELLRMKLDLKLSERVLVQPNPRFDVLV